MNAVDTNVLIYSLDDSELIKRGKARALLRQLRTSPESTVLLWQVVGEFLRQLRTWQDQGQLSRARARRYLGLYRRFFTLTLPSAQVIDRALDLVDRHSLSHWDMLLAACMEAGVNTLYTEDMGSPTRIESVQLVNPFL